MKRDAMADRAFQRNLRRPMIEPLEGRQLLSVAMPMQSIAVVHAKAARAALPAAVIAATIDNLGGVYIGSVVVKGQRPRFLRLNISAVTADGSVVEGTARLGKVGTFVAAGSLDSTGFLTLNLTGPATGTLSGTLHKNDGVFTGHFTTTVLSGKTRLLRRSDLSPGAFVPATGILTTGTGTAAGVGATGFGLGATPGTTLFSTTGANFAAGSGLFTTGTNPVFSTSTVPLTNTGTNSIFDTGTAIGASTVTPVLNTATTVGTVTPVFNTGSTIGTVTPVLDTGTPVGVVTPVLGTGTTLGSLTPVAATNASLGLGSASSLMALA